LGGTTPFVKGQNAKECHAPEGHIPDGRGPAIVARRADSSS
jgi:hypothetical protein